MKNGNKKFYNSSKDTNVISLENELTDKIGMRVILNNRRNNSGILSFEYKGNDQLDRLIKVIKNHY